MADLTINGRSFPIGGISVSLGIGAFPILQISWRTGEQVPEIPSAGAAQPATFGNGLELLITESVPANDSSLPNGGVVCVAAPLAVRRAYTGHMVAGTNGTQTRRVIWQRQTSDELANAWDFVNRICGDLFATPDDPEITTRLETAFPPGAVFLHPSVLDRKQVMEHLLQVLNSNIGEGEGLIHWCGLGEGKRPLRLISQWEPSAFQIEPHWRASGFAAPASSWSWGESVDFSKRVFHNSFGTLDSGAATKQLANFMRGKSSGWEIPLLPGLCQYQGRKVWCRRIIVNVHFREDDTSTVSAGLEMGYRPSAKELMAQMLGGANFDAWLDDQPGIALLYAGEHADWAMASMAQGHFEAQSDRALWCRVLTPAAPQGEYAGFYRRHISGDAMHATAETMSFPVAHGGFQSKNQTWEKSSLALHSTSLIVTSTPVSRDMELSELNGLRVRVLDETSAETAIVTEDEREVVKVASGAEKPGIHLSSTENQISGNAGAGISLQNKRIQMTDAKTVLDHDVDITGDLNVSD